MSSAAPLSRRNIPGSRFEFWATRNTSTCFAISLNAWIRRSLSRECSVKLHSTCLSRPTGTGTRTIWYWTSNGSLKSAMCGKAADGLVHPDNKRLERFLLKFRGELLGRLEDGLLPDSHAV